MKEFLKENIVLVAAIALPALLAVVFAVSALATRVSVEDPKYDLLVVTDNNNYNGQPYQINVPNDRVVIRYQEVKDDRGVIQYGNKPRLWKINVPEMSVEEIPLNLPDNQASYNFEIPGVTNVKVSNQSVAPDGYEFSNYYRGDNNLMTEIFSTGSSRYDSDTVLIKNGRVVKIKFSDGSFGYNTNLLGWIVEGE